MNSQVIGLISIGIIIIALGFRVARMSKEQRFRVGTLWIAPAVLALLTAFVLTIDRFTSVADIGLLLLAFVAGGAIGWYQGTHTAVRIDLAARAIFIKASPIAMLIWIAVIVLRFGIRYVTGGGQPTAAPVHGPAEFISMLLLAVAVGLVAGLRAYMYAAYARAAPARGKPA